MLFFSCVVLLTASPGRSLVWVVAPLSASWFLGLGMGWWVLKIHVVLAVKVLLCYKFPEFSTFKTDVLNSTNVQHPDPVFHDLVSASSLWMMVKS